MRYSPGQDDDLSALTDIEVRILLALSLAPAHGYGVADRCGQDAHGTIDVRTTTVYKALARLSGAGYVEKQGSQASAGSPYERTLYGVTLAGRAVLEAQLDRLGELVRLGRQRLAA